MGGRHPLASPRVKRQLEICNPDPSPLQRPPGPGPALSRCPEPGAGQPGPGACRPGGHLPILYGSVGTPALPLTQPESPLLPQLHVPRSTEASADPDAKAGAAAERPWTSHEPQRVHPGPGSFPAGGSRSLVGNQPPRDDGLAPGSHPTRLASPLGQRHAGHPVTSKQFLLLWSFSGWSRLFGAPRLSARSLELLQCINFTKFVGGSGWDAEGHGPGGWMGVRLSGLGWLPLFFSLLPLAP